jgi:hypothetical protein
MGHIRGDFFTYVRESYTKNEVFDYHLCSTFDHDKYLLLELASLSLFLGFDGLNALANRQIMTLNRHFKTETECRMFWEGTRYSEWLFSVLDTRRITESHLVPGDIRVI